MKGATVLLAILVAALMALGIAPQAQAFHSGGVAECEGCHTMHNSHEGAAMATSGQAQYSAPAYLLTGTDQSSTCLNCHEDTPGSYHISSPAGAATDAFQMTPGGDFGWLRKTYSWVPRSGAATETSEGDRHGHNVIALDYGYDAESTSAAVNSPGGTYPRANLHCSSCHDPHGRYRRTSDTAPAYTTTGAATIGSGSTGTALTISGTAVGAYRILGGAGYTPKSLGSNAFTYEPPTAVAPSTYNLSETNFQVRVAYGSGMSEWCKNCHASMHRDTYTTGTAGLSHPAGNGAVLGATIAGNYNAYIMTGATTGHVDNSFNSLIPFETGDLDFTAGLKALATSNKTKDAGPSAGANVMCLSCHRAHASGFDSILRFSYANEFMMIADNVTGAAAYPGIDSPINASKPAISQGRTVAEMQAAYYNRPADKFSGYQRSLCNKCHAKD